MDAVWQKRSSKAEMTDAFRIQFNSKISDLSRQKDCSSSHLPAQKYRSIIHRVKELKSNPSMKKAARDYRLLKQYEVVTMGTEDNSVLEMLKKPGTDLLYVTQEKLFDVISPIHISSGHGGRDIMHGRARKKYANVTKETFQLFVDLCPECRLRKAGVRKHGHDKSSISNIVRRRCRVDITETKLGDTEDYRFIMMYQDNRTKYRFLKATRTQDASEVANHLVDVFCSIGSPPILDSNKGDQFASDVVKEVKKMWPQCIMVSGANSDPNDGSLDDWQSDVTLLLRKWMRDNNSTKWWQGLRFIQWQMNNSKRGKSKKSPYAALFHEDAKLGLQHANLPNHLTADLRTENDLADTLKTLTYVSEIRKDDTISSVTCVSEIKKDDSLDSLTDVSEIKKEDTHVSEIKKEESGKCLEKEVNPSGNTRLTTMYSSDEDNTNLYNFSPSSSLTLPFLQITNPTNMNNIPCGFNTSLLPSVHCDTICPCPEFAHTCKCLECCPCNAKHRLARSGGCAICGSEVRTCHHLKGENISQFDGSIPSSSNEEYNFQIDFDFNIEDDISSNKEYTHND